MPEKFEPDVAAIEAARCQYENGASLKDLAARFGVSETTLRRHARIWRWRLRPPAARRRAADVAADEEAVAVAVADTESERSTNALARRVEIAVRRELSAIERRLGASTTASAERNARVLASLVKSLAELRKLDHEAKASAAVRNEGDEDEGARPPRDLARLREELEATLARIRPPRETG